MRVACLVDVTRCIGCRSCQVACKQSNDRKGEKTRFFGQRGGYQNPARYSAETFTYISFHETESADGLPAWSFVKRQCMHCETLYCAMVCPPKVFRKTSTGVIDYQPDICIGCAACIDACPFEVPTIDYFITPGPRLMKCGFCLARQESKTAAALRTPACIKACPTGTLTFGPRERLIKEAKRRIDAHPDRYVDRIYGQHEAGGTGWLYLTPVPAAELGFPEQFDHPLMVAPVEDFGQRSRLANFLATISAGFVWLVDRRNRLRQE